MNISLISMEIFEQHFQGFTWVLLVVVVMMDQLAIGDGAFFEGRCSVVAAALRISADIPAE